MRIASTNDRDKMSRLSAFSVEFDAIVTEIVRNLIGSWFASNGNLIVDCYLKSHCLAKDRLRIAPVS